MQHNKHPLDPSLIPLANPSASRPVPRLPKRSLRLSSKHSSAPYSFPDPSPGLLAILVTVAGSSSVDGRPHDSDVPPDFLCPRLHTYSSAQPSASQDTAPLYREPCDVPEATTSSRSSFTPAPVDLYGRARRKRVRRTANIADKYVQSPDGRWRKADSWQLYGSSSCAASQCMDATPTEVPVEDDQVSASAAATASASTSSSSSTDPTLPHGWGGNKTEDDMTGIILGLSLSLAFALIAFMIGVVLWRRKRRKREKDTEKTAPSIDTRDTEVSEQAQRVRSKQRLWQRVAVKWKANVKHSARLRRKRATTAATRPSDTDLLSDRPTIQASTSAVSLTRTRTVSDGDSAYTARPLSIHGDDPRLQRSRSPSVASSDIGTGTTDAELFSLPTSQPPAYIPSSPFHRARSTPHLTPSDAPSGSLDPAKACSSSDVSCDPSVPYPYGPPVHSAHVATDDKAVLAQMARMASAPPADGPSMSDATGGLSEVQPSVPVLEEDPFETLPSEMQPDVDTDDEHAIRQGSNLPITHDALSMAILTAPSSYPGSYLPVDDDGDSDVPSYAEDAIRHPTLVLPPPPRKVPLTGPMFYEYPHEFEEDVASVEPPDGPSSPPFEEPSALPFALAVAPDSAHMIVPSAPPLEIEDERLFAAHLLPSAPPLDDDAEHVPVHDAGSPSAPCGPLPCASSSAPGDHRNVNRDDIPGAAPPERAAISGDDVLPPQYLP
ncbi:hypothetical protein BD309DRAFT_644058 [Dichomitus squalens]|nr:hypothetical protein BD309DRAFT_644058 [Dichomitus squalens]